MSRINIVVVPPSGRKRRFAFRLEGETALLRGLSGFFSYRVGRLLSLVNDLRRDLLGLADGLIGLTFRAQLIVAREARLLLP